jgi:Holliday junction DNA helicase RuvA
MIAFLQGEIAALEPTRVVLDVHGVGYEVWIPLSSYDRLPGPGKPVRLLTFLHVREDAHVLYGFFTAAERKMFELLLAVSGIGPKTALGALSGMSVRELTAAIAGNEVKRLSSLSGIGKKTAERIVVELKDRLHKGDVLEALHGGPQAGPGDALLRDAVLALSALGFKPPEASQRVQRALQNPAVARTVEAVVREALAGAG